MLRLWKAVGFVEEVDPFTMYQRGNLNSPMALYLKQNLVITNFFITEKTTNIALFTEYFISGRKEAVNYENVIDAFYSFIPREQN